MDKPVQREIYLWQALLILFVVATALFSAGHYYKEKILTAYYNYHFRSEDYDPVTKIDHQMMELEDKIQENPNSTSDYLQLGWIYYKKGAPKEAIKVYLKILDIEPNHVGALYNLGLIYMDQKNYNQAQHYFAQIVNKYPDHESAGIQLVKVYYITKKYQEAQTIIYKIQPYMSTNADFFYYFGLVREKLGDRKHAITALRKAVSFDPTFTEAQVQLNRLNNLK